MSNHISNNVKMRWTINKILLICVVSVCCVGFSCRKWIADGYYRYNDTNGGNSQMIMYVCRDSLWFGEQVADSIKLFKYAYILQKESNSFFALTTPRFPFASWKLTSDTTCEDEFIGANIRFKNLHIPASFALNNGELPINLKTNSTFRMEVHDSLSIELSFDVCCGYFLIPLHYTEATLPKTNNLYALSSIGDYMYYRRDFLLERFPDSTAVTNIIINLDYDWIDGDFLKRPFFIKTFIRNINDEIIWEGKSFRKFKPQ